MTDFNPLNPHTRCFALVGEFLYRWSVMESKIKEAITKSLGLNIVQGAIVTSNISLRDKIYILKTAVDLSEIKPKEEREKFKSVLQKVANYSPTRNMVAHDRFEPVKDKLGVRFGVIKAKGKLNIPHTEWSEDKFQEEFEKIEGFSREIDNLKSKLDRAALINALQSPKLSAAPKAGLFGPILGSFRAPPTPDNPDSDTDPSSPQTNPQTPSSSED